MCDNSILNQNPITGQSGSCMAVARAATGIYLALKNESIPEDRKILVPANLCYAGIYPAVYAGLCPCFCDVDPVTGNVTFETFQAACTWDTAAAVVPHMYGNPVEDLPAIADYCTERGILLIEDCASAMGAQAEHYPLGEIGDYVIYSTGYAKTLDLGFGGLLFSSSRNLQPCANLEQSLPPLDEASEKNQAFFSRLYRLIRNEGQGTAIEQMIFQRLPECCRDDFLQSLPEEKKEWLFAELRALPAVKLQRRNALNVYRKATEDLDLQQYPFSQGAVPWRFNLLIKPEKRRQVIHACLERGLPVSDWYPRITNLFGQIGDFPGAREHENRILNFPLLIEPEKREEICRILREYCGSSKPAARK